MQAVARTWEYREISLPRGTTREVARQLLTGAAETGHWELARTHLYPDGRRKVLLRRRVYRVSRTDLAPA
ncbi:MAG: hypothetical protein KGP12_00930 [Actinomycetales bacterium]|nr:hypothetical protein [Actinomycetales bacterium]